MKKLKKVTLGFIVLICNACAFADSFSGLWDWNDAPGPSTFSIKLKEQGRVLRGQYCAVAQNGNKIDCDDEQNANIEGHVDAAGQSAVVRFSSFFGAKSGKAQLKIDDGRLVWHIIKKPVEGEVYAPKHAVLDRQQ
ncbi:hypothetical protein VSR82_05350 [Burkholderia sp. JPY481]|uniref:hypothetical protein n=1 Tax=Paraburkholderia sp. JPY465 TaxID=3042285 RepID=UPI00317363D7